MVTFLSVIRPTRRGRSTLARISPREPAIVAEPQLSLAAEISGCRDGTILPIGYELAKHNRTLLLFLVHRFDPLFGIITLSSISFGRSFFRGVGG